MFVPPSPGGPVHSINMEKRILLRGARQLVTLHGPRAARRGAAMRELGVIQDGAVLIVDGMIRDVGPSRRVENLAAARQAIEISADGRVVMPGFVDARTSLIAGPPLLDDYETRITGAAGSGAGASEPAPEALIRAVRNSSRPRLELLARKALKEFVRHGTTTLEAKSGLGLDEKTELKILRALQAVDGRPLEIMSTFFGAAAVAPDHNGTSDDYLDWILDRVLPKIRRLKLARFAEVRCGEGAFTPEQARRYLLAAREQGFLLRLTTDEFTSSGAVRLAVELGAASVDHLEHLSEEDCGVLADSATVATLVPGASFHRRREVYAPARALIDGGAAVALATGYSSDRCPSCNMSAILSLACNQMGMTPAEAVTAATINGAHALRCADRVGSLEYGKQADLIMLNVPDYREIPYHFGMNPVTLTMKRGDVICPRMEFPWSRS